MKRILVFCLVLAMTLTLFTGCRGKGNVSDTDNGKVDGTNGSVMTEPASGSGSTATSAPAGSANPDASSTDFTGESGMTPPDLTEDTAPVKPARVTKN